MQRSTDFSRVVRAGVRARGRRLLVHHYADLGAAPSGAGPLVGLVVSKAVGGSVTRHQVSRRLRAQLATRLEKLPSGSGTVVRALPNAAASSSAELAADLDTAIAAALARLGRR